MWDFWTSTDPATLIFEKDGHKTVMNFWPVSMTVEVRAPPITLDSRRGPWTESSHQDMTFDLRGAVSDMVWDAEIRYLKEQFTQKRIDIVNIDPALKWQPKEKVA